MGGCLAGELSSPWLSIAANLFSHALRGGLDMNLHRALDRLATEPTEPRSEADERDLGQFDDQSQQVIIDADINPVVSARIWLNCYMHDHL